MAIFISSEKIDKRVSELSREISQSYKGKPLTFLIIANGALFFASDLIRKISIPLELDILSVSSYIGTSSTGKINILSQFKINLGKRNIIIIDDILDTGNTLFSIKEELKKYNPENIKSCVLLKKKKERKYNIDSEYIGFEIEDQFVVGYGLDYNEKYRNLPYIKSFNPQLENISKIGRLYRV